MSDLDKFRFFDPEDKVRQIALKLYENVKDLPIVCPHGHVDPTLFSTNRRFPNPTELILIPDHYIFRMLYSVGIKLEDLGVPTVDGSEVEKDPRKIWQIFADNFYLFAGTPTGVWLNHEFRTIFGIREKFNSENAMDIYDSIAKKLAEEKYRPRQMFDDFGIEVLTTTDSATDSLEAHREIRDSSWSGQVVPCFRPDAVVNINSPMWFQEIELLGKMSNESTVTYKGYIKALENRREFFKSMGASSTDHAVIEPYTHRMSHKEAEAIYSKALLGKATLADSKAFSAHMLMEMARMSCDDGLVMQLHPGSLRDHNMVIHSRFGLDKGCDIPVATEYTQNLKELLNSYGNNPDFTFIVFTLDESNYARELAPLAGHYPAMKLGPAWWFNDSIEGMTRFRHSVTETAGFYNTVGFNDDTRAFPSIPARHDVSRRVDANYLAGQVARHIISMDDALQIGKALAYDLVKKNYKL